MPDNTPSPASSSSQNFLVTQVLAGNHRAVARLITHIENEHPAVIATLSQLYSHTGKAHLIGITGAPGTGKSSLVNQLAKAFRQTDRTVAILAIDPTSPISGGAILGDRIRMPALAGDKGVFIRSMANRGSLGGLAQAAYGTISVLDAAGFDIILIETVGIGQSEVDIAGTAHTTILVEAPGLGDDIQAIKAGILEVADIIIVNKSDRPGADKTAATLKAMLKLSASPPQERHHGQYIALDLPPDMLDNPAWDVPIIQTIASQNIGIEQTIAAVDQHQQHLQNSHQLNKRNWQRLANELETLLQQLLMKQVINQVSPAYFSEIVAKLVNRTLTPYNAAQTILTACNLTFSEDFQNVKRATFNPPSDHKR